MTFKICQLVAPTLGALVLRADVPGPKLRDQTWVPAAVTEVLE